MQCTATTCELTASAHVQAGTAEAEEPEKPWPQQPFRRGWRFNWPGVVLMAIYCLAFIFYLYIRIRYTLDLGSYVWCGPPHEAASYPKPCAKHARRECACFAACRGVDHTRHPCRSLPFASKQPVPCAAQTIQRSACIYRAPPTGRWGAFVLGVEVLGATSTVLYGLNIILTPVHEPLIDDPANPGLTKVGRGTA